MVFSTISRLNSRMDERAASVDEGRLLGNGNTAENVRLIVWMFERCLNEIIYSSCCQSFKLLSHAHNPRVRDTMIYRADLRTLMEERWESKRSRPYDGTTVSPARPIGNIWQDYHFGLPRTTVLKQTDLSISRDLHETRQKERCPKCSAG